MDSVLLVIDHLGDFGRNWPSPDSQKYIDTSIGAVYQSEKFVLFGA